MNKKMIKKITLLTLSVALFSVSLLSAQIVPPTSGGAASSNPPPSWVGATASTSNKTFFQGNAAKPWQNGPLPGVPGQLNATFLSLYSNNSVIKEASTTITGLSPGWTYKIKYHVMAASALTPAGHTDVAYAAEVEADGTSGENQYNFTAANSSKWIEGTLEFTANATTQKLAFRALGQTAKGSIVNLSIIPGAIQSVCGQNAQVTLTKTSLYNKCFQPYANLNEAFTGVIPAGSSLRWFTNNTHLGLLVADPTKVTTPGNYYAFLFNGSCYNTDLSLAQVTVNILPLLPGNGQVILTVAALTNECPVTSTVDLTKAFTGQLPAGAALVWYNNPTHSGLPVMDPAHAPVSVPTYYAFYYDIGGYCYNTNNSTAIVKITQRPCDQAARTLSPWPGRSEERVFTDVKIYPNPVSDKIYIETEDFEGVSEIQILDLQGAIVYKSDKVTKEIDTKNLTSGTYLIRVIKKNRAASSYKIVVSK
jgi:hypothetical protein